MDDTSPTPPSSCGLAIALPVEHAAIERALSGGPYVDYVGRGALWGSASELWKNNFEAVAMAAISCSQDAERLGVTVRQNSTLTDLSHLFGECEVVTVVAHWRGPEISKQDIVLTSHTLIGRIASDTSDVATRLRAGFAPEWLGRLDDAGTENARRSRLAELLNARMRGEPTLSAPPVGTEWHMDATTRHHHNRSCFDTWWPGSLRPGNRLELADGLHAPLAIAGTVPDSWRGIADFSNCQSAQLANVIKQCRSDRIVIANEGETDPQRRLALLTVIYKLLSDGKSNYAAARFAMARRLLQEGAGTYANH